MRAPARTRNLTQLPLRRRVSRPQLKRDPLGVNAMASVAHHFRQHPGLVWLGAVAVMAAVLGVGGASSMDGGVGSMLFVLFAIIGAPFLLAGRIGVGLTSWAPIPVQVGAVVILAIGVALLLDHPLRRFLSRLSAFTGSQS